MTIITALDNLYGADYIRLVNHGVLGRGLHLPITTGNHQNLMVVVNVSDQILDITTSGWIKTATMTDSTPLVL